MQIQMCAEERGGSGSAWEEKGSSGGGKGLQEFGLEDWSTTPVSRYHRWCCRWLAWFGDALMLTPRLAGVLRLKVRGPGGVDTRKTQRRVAPTIPCHLVTYVERFDVCVCLCMCVNKNICICLQIYLCVIVAVVITVCVLARERHWMHLSLKKYFCFVVLIVESHLFCIYTLYDFCH